MVPTARAAEVAIQGSTSLAELRALVLALLFSGRLDPEAGLTDHTPRQPARLGDVVRVIRGITFPASAKNAAPAPGLLPCLRTTNVQWDLDLSDLLYVSESYVKSADKFLRSGDIVVSTANSLELVGKSSLARVVDGRQTFGGFLSVLRPDSSVDPEYLWLLMNSPQVLSTLRSAATRTTNIANISTERLRGVQLYLPGIAQQRQLARVVRQLLESSRELSHLRQLSATLGNAVAAGGIERVAESSSRAEANARWGELAGELRRLLRDGESRSEAVELLRGGVATWAIRGLFVGEGVRGEAHPCIEAGRREVMQRSEALRIPASDLRAMQSPEPNEPRPNWLPESWSWVTLGSIGHTWGQTVPRREFTYIDVSSVDGRSGRITQRAKLVSPSEAPSRARKVVRPGDVIYSTVRPYLRNVAVVPEGLRPEPIASTAFAVLHPVPGVLAEYLHLYLRTPFFNELVRRLMVGAAYPAIGEKVFRSCPAPIPPTAEQERIVRIVRSIDEHLVSLEDCLDREQTLASEVALISLGLASRSPSQYEAGEH